MILLFHSPKGGVGTSTVGMYASTSRPVAKRLRPDGTSQVSGNFIQADSLCSFCAFDVRFGIKDGERRAYLTWVDSYSHHHTGNIVDLDVVDGKLVMKQTNVPVPGN